MKNILIHEEENFFSLSLNRPEKKNALNLEMIQSLTQFFSNPPSKAVLLKGEGSVFCAGADLKWISSAPEKELALLFELFETIQSSSAPVLAHIQGFVYGGGIGLISVCDFVSAESAAKFCFSELKLGLMPAVIAPFVLQKSPQMRSYMLSGKLFPSEEALKRGLIQFTGSSDKCGVWRQDQFKILKKLHQESFAETKKFFSDLPSISKKDLKNFCIKTLEKRRKSASTQNLIKSFLKKDSS